jgi:ATP adenylyltransferase
MSLYFIVTIAFLFGVLVVGFYGIIERFRLKREIKSLLSASREKDKELNSLRNLPITSDDVSPSQVDTSEEE